MFAIFGIMYRYSSEGRRNTAVRVDNLLLQPLEDDALSKSARHKTISQASVYMKNCLNKWESSGCHTDMWMDNKVSPWKSIHYGSGNNVRRNDHVRSRTNKDLPEIAVWYIRRVLKFPASYTWREALQKSEGICSNQTALEKLHDLLLKDLSQERRLLALEYLTTVRRTVVQDLGEVQEPEDGEVEKSVEMIKPVQEGAVVAVQNKRANEDGEKEDDKAKKKRQKRNKSREKNRRGENPITFGKERKQLADLGGSSREVLFQAMETTITQLRELKSRGVLAADFAWLKKLRTSHTTMKRCIQDCHGGEHSSFFGLECRLSLQKYHCSCKKHLTSVE